MATQNYNPFVNAQTQFDKVAEMLDLAMDLAIELPLYQRKNILAYNGDNVDLSSFPEETTAFWDYSSELWKIRMN